MSIRAIAKEIYACQSAVHKLEELLEKTDSYSEKEKINESLRVKKAELKILKNMLEGRKTQSLESKGRFPHTF